MRGGNYKALSRNIKLRARLNGGEKEGEWKKVE